MRAIVAIGGGDIATGETRRIDEYIVSLSEKDEPDVLILATASGDNPGYIQAIQNAYHALGCRTESLMLMSPTMTDEAIRERILNADIIYVGGGDTELLMDIWRRHGIDHALNEAWKKGVILSGLSAGALCWFRNGVTDREENGGAYLVWLECLGLIPMTLGPHYNHAFWQDYDGFLAERGLSGLALEDNTALAMLDDHLFLIKGDDIHNSWMLRCTPNGIEKRLYEGGLY